MMADGETATPAEPSAVLRNDSVAAPPLGWRKPGWRLFRRLFQLALRLPEPVLDAFSGRDTKTSGTAPLDARAAFHARFVTRFRRPAAPGAAEPGAVEARQPALLSLALLDGPPLRNVHCADFTIPGHGGPIAVRSYRPRSLPATPAPVLIYLHFGGCVIGDLDTCHTACTLIADRAGCVVLSVDYRLAPEHRFPAALDDTVAALAWARSHAASIGGDPSRVAVGGDSAGGYLAAAASLSLHEAGEPPPFLQLLIYPVLEMDRRSMPPTAFDDDYPLSRADMVWFSDLYMRDATDATDPLCSVRRTASVAEMPPTILAGAGHDLLHDEGIAFAQRLSEAGVPVTRLDFPALPHAFTAMSGGLPAARDAILDIADAVGRAFRADARTLPSSGERR